jgi:hypothetical protein
MAQLRAFILFEFSSRVSLNFFLEEIRAVKK